MNVKDIFLTHLLLPVSAFIFLVAMMFINARNAVLTNKKLIVFILIVSIFIAIPGVFTVTGIKFMPFYYINIQVLFLLSGYFYMKKCDTIFSSPNETLNKTMIVLSSLAVLALGSYLFALVFNFLGEFNYGFAASSSTYTFIIPIFLKWSYEAMLEIPGEIYKIWKYNAHYTESNFTSETIDQIVVLELELSKKPEDKTYIKVKAKAPVDFTFGEWFQMFIHDYNIKYLDSPISYQQSNGEMYGWIFYTKPSLFRGKVFIDHEKSIGQNGLAKVSNPIICKRVDML